MSFMRRYLFRALQKLSLLRHTGNPSTPHWKCPIGIEIGVEDSALGLALWAEGHQVPSTGCDHTITVGLSQPQPPAPPLLFS